MGTAKLSWIRAMGQPLAPTATALQWQGLARELGTKSIQEAVLPQPKPGKLQAGLGLPQA